MSSFSKHNTIMKKYLIFFVIMFAVSPLSMNGQQSQKSNTGFDSGKLIFGGDIGFGISQNSWTVGGSPQIGYKLTNRFHIGAGIGYRYARSDRDYYAFTGTEDNGEWQIQNFHYTENSASLNIFARYYPWKKLVFSIKPEIMHTWYRGSFGNDKYSATKFVPAFIVGGGLHLKPVILQLNYELIHNRYSPYSDKVFLSIGFML